MAVTDNRTQLQDCDATADVASDSNADPQARTTETGLLIEGGSAIAFQVTDAQEYIAFDLDSTGSTFSLNLSDSTVYICIKDNLNNSFANLGGLVVFNDGADGGGGDCIGYAAGGNDATGLPYRRQYSTFKLDVSVVVASPGTDNVDYFTYNGTEANLDHTAVLQVGYGSIHLAKAVGTTANAWFDGIYYIANDSYAATINGGTAGTPETMSDVVGDDETSGMGMFANPKGTEYDFIAPTQWGNSAATAEHAFSATNEQWFWLGDNGGGHAVGATHFPFRVIGNATDTGTFIMTNVVVVNTGTGADFDCSDTNVNTLEIDGCTFIGLSTMSAPSSGGTSRYCTNTIFLQCGAITHNGADMSGGSVLESTVAADDGALFFNETTDPDTVMDGMTFSKGANAHHAIRFGTSVDGTATSGEITLRNCEFTGFGSTDDANDSTVRFDDTTGTLTLNLIGCTVGGAAATSSNFSIDDAAGITVTLVIDPVTTLVHVADENGDDLAGAHILLEASDGTGDFPFEDTVTITNVTTTASVSHTAHGLSNGDKIVIRGANEQPYNGVWAISNVTTNAYDYTMNSDPGGSATGTVKATGAILGNSATAATDDVTDANGDLSKSRTFGLATPVKGVVRKSSAGSTRYKTFPITGTISTSIGLTVNVQMIPDE